MKSGRVVLENGEEIGTHVTEKKEEILIVLKGTATLIVEGKRISIEKGQTRYIPEGREHNVLNEKKETLEYVYVVALMN